MATAQVGELRASLEIALELLRDLRQSTQDLLQRQAALEERLAALDQRMLALETGQAESRRRWFRLALVLAGGGAAGGAGLVDLMRSIFP